MAEEFLDKIGLARFWERILDKLAGLDTRVSALESGASGTFTTVDSKTVTVVDGKITNIQ